MTIKKHHKLEKAYIQFLNFDGWDLKWTGDGQEVYDAIGMTAKGHKCVIEMKFRNEYYEEKMLEKKRYDELMLIDDNILKLYFVNDPKGNFMFWLNKIIMPKPVKKYCPDTSLWTKKRIKKDVYLLNENQASKINLNK
tara:strand:+ start:135 stop:548 length:414 start_codon:yes stop_codon:yes gene_type:complete